jgi:aquaporin Z
MKKYLIEFIGTFFLVLIIAFTGNPIAIGGGLTALVYMGGYISGAQYNPAVTLGLWLSNKINAKIATYYIITQCIASLAAAATYYFIQNSLFVPQIPRQVPFTSALLIEILFTFLLVSVVLHVAATEKTHGNQYYGLAIGFTVMAAAFVGGPISGAAYNPAVGLGPILFDVNNFVAHIPSLLVYLVGPFAGGTLASLVYKMKA